MSCAVGTARWVSSCEDDSVVPAPDDLTELVRRAADGDELAWNLLVDRFTNLLWSIGRAYRLDTGAAADVIQTTWLRLLENLDTIRDPETLAGWLATTARRECLATLRRSGREAPEWSDEAMLEVPDEGAPPVDHHLLLAERDAALWQSFGGLSARCQTLLRVLMSVERTSYAEISTALGLPIGSIGPTRMRCLDRLRELLAASGYAFGTATAEGSP